MIYKKGQAAMEFLMTYGWAILAAIIAIGVLAYFGVFSPGTFISNSITMNAPFGATQELSINTTNLVFVMRNGGGDRVNVSSIGVAGCGTTFYTGANVMIIPDGGNELISITCPVGLLVSGDKFRGNINISYWTGEELVALTGTGSILGRVV